MPFNICAKEQPPNLWPSLERLMYRISPPSPCSTGSTTLVMSSQWPAAETITVPGDKTSPWGYFCFMERESFPVGTLMPRATTKSERASTAWYSRASSPSFLQGHIQFAERDTDLRPSSKGAQTRLVRDSPTLFLLPATGSIKPEMGEWPKLVAIPCFPLKSKAIAPQLFKGSCRGPTHCCLATRPPTQRSTLLVSQSLEPTASNCRSCSRYSWKCSREYSRGG